MNRLQKHMIKVHGWPEETVLAGRWVDFMDTSKGTRPIPLAELETKHGFDHSSGAPKFTAFQAHTHRKGTVR